MASASGLDGQVTFDSGYTTDLSAWKMSIFSTPLDKTAFQPTDDHQVLCGDMVNGAEGSYIAELCVDTDADITDTGNLYEPYPYRWVFRSEMEPRLATTFQDSWHSWNIGLISSQLRMQTWLSTTLAPPAVATGAASLVINSTESYDVPYRSTQIDIGVDVDDGGQRNAIIQAAATAGPTANGGLPLPGVTGTATFLVGGTAQYAGTILVTAVEATVDRIAPEGQIMIEYVVDGELSPTGA